MLEIATPQLPLWSDADTPAGGFSLRPSRRARRLTVRVLHTGRVEVVVPVRTSRTTVEYFLHRHRDWIERRRVAVRAARPPQPFPPPQIELAACGEVWRVHLAGGSGRLRAVPRAPGVLALVGAAPDGSGLRRALRVWLLRHAREVLAPELQACAAELGLGYQRITVRRQRTRWGSCSARGTISLNCCLVFQKPEVLRYLLVHELVHTVHMNHSRRFWERVAQHCPDYRRLDAELLDGWRHVPAWMFDDDEER